MTTPLSRVEAIARREAEATGRPHVVLNLNRAGAPLYVCRELRDGIEADRIVSRFDPPAPVEPTASVVGAPARPTSVVTERPIDRLRGRTFAQHMARIEGDASGDAGCAPARPASVVALEALNVGIVRAALERAGLPADTHLPTAPRAYLDAYLAVMGERRKEVFAAIEAAGRDAGATGSARHFVDGMAAAYARATVPHVAKHCDDYQDTRTAPVAAPAPAMVPQPVQQQQARDTRDGERFQLAPGAFPSFPVRAGVIEATDAPQLPGDDATVRVRFDGEAESRFVRPDDMRPERARPDHVDIMPTMEGFIMRAHGELVRDDAGRVMRFDDVRDAEAHFWRAEDARADTGPAYLAIQCQREGHPRGTFLYQGDNWRTGRLVSPVFEDSVRLYQWATANGWHSLPYDPAHPVGVYARAVSPAPAMVPQPVQQQQGRDLRGVISIRDLADVETPSHPTYSRAEMDAARALMVARNLRIDNRTGTVRDDRLGELSRFSNPADHTPYTSAEDVMRWAFRPYLANSASRVSRGYSA